jgi:hypothetical protein
MATQRQEQLEQWYRNEERLQREEFARQGSQEKPAHCEYERWKNHQAELERQERQDKEKYKD